MFGDMNIKDITPEFLLEHDINPEGMAFGPNFLPYNPRLKQFGRDLRNYGQKSEAMLWKCLKSKQTGYIFLRQKPILNYIADFYCYKLRLVIEIDGASHFSAEAQARDAERDRQMQAIGLTVIRVRDSDVRKNPWGVAKSIMEMVLEKRELAQSGYSESPLPPFEKGDAQSDAGAKPSKSKNQTKSSKSSSRRDDTTVTVTVGRDLRQHPDR